MEKTFHQDRTWWRGGADYELHSVTNHYDGTELKAWVMRNGRMAGTLFLAHGFTRTTVDVMETGRKKAQQFGLCCMGWDARMHGNSGDGALSFGWNESFDVEALLNKANELGLPRPYILYGISLGGMTARIAARRFPAVDGAIIIQAPPSPHSAIETVVPAVLRAPLRAILECAESRGQVLAYGDPANCPLHPDAHPLVLEVLGYRDMYDYGLSCGAFETWNGPKAYNVNPLAPEAADKRFFRLDLDVSHPGSPGPGYWECPAFYEYEDALIQRTIQEFGAQMRAEGEGWELFGRAENYDWGYGVPASKAMAREYYRQSMEKGNGISRMRFDWLSSHDAYVRMTDGEEYEPTNGQLEEIRNQTAEVCREFNRTEAPECLRRGQLHMAGDACITAPFTCDYATNIFIGSGTYLNKDCHLGASAAVRIGSHVLFGPGVRIITECPLDHAPGRCIARPVTIGDNSWICGRVTIMPGVSIGPGAVVAAGAVVTEDVPPNALARGNPAKAVKIINQD